MNKDLALEILTVAAEGGYLEGGVQSVGDDRVLEMGQYYLDEARKAQAAGMNADAIVRIVELGSVPYMDTDITAEQQEAENEETEQIIETTHTQVEVELPEAQAVVEEETPDDAGQRESEGEQDRESAPAPSVPTNGLPVPPEIEGDPEQMPFDLTKLSDREVRRLHGAFNAYLARATWLFAQASKSLSQAETMRDHAMRQARRRVDRLDPETDKAKLRSVIDDEAMEDEEYKTWSSRVEQHEGELEDMRALKEIYKGNVDRLSREWTMRSEEFQRSGGR